MAPDISSNFVLEELNFFPSVINGKIDFMGFMQATSDLLILIGMTFTITRSLYFKFFNSVCKYKAILQIGLEKYLRL